MQSIFCDVENTTNHKEAEHALEQGHLKMLIELAQYLPMSSKSSRTVANPES
jgi:hypothetical protein